MMRRRKGRDIVHRWEGNPVITIEDMPFQCNDICNAGVARPDGGYLLLLTVENLEGRHAVYPARSDDGYRFAIGTRPFLAPSAEEPYAEYEEHGVLDARVTFLEGYYYISYDARGRHGYRVGLARTTDFERVERVGMVSEPDTKGGVLFPRRIRGRYARLERPWAGGSVWVSYSDDLKYWGGSEVILTPRSGFWDSDHVGVGVPPIETEHGWLCIYYGVKRTSAGPLFRLGAVFLDLDDPSRVVGRTNVPILSPREEYERVGDVPNLVFTCGAVTDGETIRIYYGGSNSCICLGTTDIHAILNACVESERVF